MRKFNIWMGLFLVMAFLLTGCEAYTLASGQSPDGAGQTKPGQFPGAANNSSATHVPGGANSPDTVTKLNNQPQTPSPHDFTKIPNSALVDTPVPGATLPVADWPVYKDASYPFQISYPPQYEARVLDSTGLSRLKVKAVAGLDFVDPTRIIGGIAFSNFNIRLYQFEAGSNVEKWLEQQGLYQPGSDWTIAAYDGKHFSGYKVNSAQFIAPGEFIYAVHGGFIYQLTPVGGEAQTMLTTFEFTP